MNALETKLNFSIFNAILFGSLRPWIAENQNQERFSLILMNGLRSKIPSVDAFFKELISATKEANIDLNDDDFIESSILAKEYKDPLSLDLPPFINKKREFYGSLIKNETLRNQAVIDHIISSQIEDDIAYSEANNLIQNIEYLIRESAKVQETDDDNLYIINCIKYSLFLLNKYMKDSFPDLLSVNILSDSEIIYMLAPNQEEDNLINQYLAEQSNKVKSDTTRKESQVPISSSNLKSFYYTLKDIYPEKIMALYDNLKEQKLICNNTNFASFKKILSGRQITSPIVWTGNISELNYFIKLIHNINKSVKDLKQQHWEVACKCFVNADGKPYERTHLKEQKIPKLSVDKLEKAANLLK